MAHQRDVTSTYRGFPTKENSVTGEIQVDFLLSLGRNSPFCRCRVLAESRMSSWHKTECPETSHIREKDHHGKIAIIPNFDSAQEAMKR